MMAYSSKALNLSRVACLLAAAKFLPLKFDPVQKKILQNSIAQLSVRGWGEDQISGVLSAHPTHPSLALVPIAECMTEQLQSKEPARFGAILDFVMLSLKTHSVPDSVLSGILDHVATNLKMGDAPVVDLLINLVTLGARTVAQDGSTSLLITLAQKGYPKTVLSIAEAAPTKANLKFVAKNGVSVLKIVTENVEKRMFGWPPVLKPLQELAK